jgi:hypothetical protein
MQTYKQHADYKLENLNKTPINTGILYDRMLPIADIERFKQQNQFSDTTGPRHWIQAYYELYQSAYNTSGWTTPETLENGIDINPDLDNGIPIGILNYKYNLMDSNAYVDNLLDTLPNGQFIDVSGRPRNPYFTYSTFIASPLISDDEIFTENENYTFYLDTKFFVYNEFIDIKHILLP